MLRIAHDYEVLAERAPKPSLGPFTKIRLTHCRRGCTQSRPAYRAGTADRAYSPGSAGDHRRLPSRGLKIAAGSVDDKGEKKRKHMAARTEKGRRTTRHDAVATIRLSSELRESVDAWAAKQTDKPARPEAILRHVELGLETTRRRASAPNRAAKASEMAAQEIDRISDPSATKEERQLRKRRLIKGPKEFRDIHKKSREDR